MATRNGETMDRYTLLERLAKRRAIIEAGLPYDDAQKIARAVQVGREACQRPLRERRLMIEKEYQDWRLAGELFGRLRAALGFGDLTMVGSDSSDPSDPSVIYRWSFKARGQRHSVARVVPFRQLGQWRSVPAFAESLATVFKSKFRELPHNYEEI